MPCTTMSALRAVSLCATYQGACGAAARAADREAGALAERVERQTAMLAERAAVERSRSVRARAAGSGSETPRTAARR